MTTGRIDTHCHLLPGVDDGCDSVEDSIACARVLVEAGYTDAVCTPHIWSSYPHKTPAAIVARVKRLQAAYDQSGVALRLHPGGEHNLQDVSMNAAREELITYGMQGKYLLADLWVDRIPQAVWEHARRLKDYGIQLILAHPERMRAIQDDPSIADLFRRAGVLLQGNLQCFGDPPGKHTRTTADLLISEGAYFMVGSDTHRPDGLEVRMRGLENLRASLPAEDLDRLTIHNPAKLLS